MTTEFFRHLNELVYTISKTKNSAERTGHTPQFEAADLLLDCIHSGLEDNYKKCGCGNWHDEEGDLCKDCQNYESTVLKDQLAWLGR